MKNAKCLNMHYGVLLKHSLKCFAAIICLLCVGCGQMSIYKDYAYQDAAYQIAGGILEVRLLGTDNKVNDSLTIRESPYNLVVGITLNAPPKTACSFSIKSLRLVSAKDGGVLFSKSGVKEDFAPSWDKRTYDATMLFRGLKLNFVDYDLDLTFSLDPECSHSGAEARVKLPLKTNYQEKKITVWDMLMGI